MTDPELRDDYEQRLRDMNEALLTSSVRQQELTEQAEHAETRMAAAELRGRLLLEGIPQLVWTAAGDGEWTWSSPQWTDFTRLSAEESLGHGWLQALHPEDRERTSATWHESAAAQQFQVEHRVRAGSGRYCWFASRAHPVRDREGGQILGWVGTSTDIDDLRRLQDEQKVMVAELQHRTRNLLALVRSIARQTMERTGPTEAFRTQFNDRLAALGRVQGLLSSVGSEPITIGELLRMELDALGDAASADKITLAGPEVKLPSAVVQTLALALHELATNARKYGALASRDGRLRVTWTVREAAGEGRCLKVEWVENGIDREPQQEQPRGKGYGRELIERALPYSLNAQTSFELTEEGVRCMIDLPLAGVGGERDSRDRHDG